MRGNGLQKYFDRCKSQDLYEQFLFLSFQIVEQIMYFLGLFPRLL